MIEFSHVSFRYESVKVLEQVNGCLKNGEVVGVIGPNGAGKSTLLRLCARILVPQEGSIRIDGRNASDYRQKELARQLAFLPQSRPVPALSVRSLVMLGRFAHGKGDRKAVEMAMETVGIAHLAGRDVRTLSGGQRQMAYLAMLLSQESPNVLLDEPLTHLDVAGQLDTAQVIRRMKEQGKCVAVVLHDLNMLEKVCDRALVLSGGTIAFEGTASECLRSHALEEAFQVKVLPGQGVGFEKRSSSVNFL